MRSEGLPSGLAIFASSYIKRWMETNYDALLKTPSGRKLLEAGSGTRHGIEAAMYALLAYAERHWSADTPLQKLFREVAMDAPSEIAKRLVNGFREEVRTSERSDDDSRSVEHVLLQLEEQTLAALLAWLSVLGAEERLRISALLTNLTDDEVQKALALTPEALGALANLSASPPRPSSRLAAVMKDEMQKAHRRVDEQLARYHGRERP